MNAAARYAIEHQQAHALWFIHADSRISKKMILDLHRGITAAPDAIYYFPLTFYDGDWRMQLIEFGVALRCRLLATPYGDQGLCIPRAVFTQLGYLDEDTPHGEDHLFILSARKAGVALRRINTPIGTSARKYIEQGWWKVWWQHQKIAWRQWWSYR